MTDKKLLSDHFTPWSASPYHLLHPFMQSIMPTTILVLGHIEKGKQNLEHFTSNKTKTSKHQTFWENVWVWLNFFFGFPSCFVLLLFEMDKQKTIVFCFLHGYYQSRYQKAKKLQVLFGFWDFSMQKTTPNILKSQWFFDILIDHIHYKKQNTTVFCFSISNKKQLGKPPKTFESKPNILSKVFFVVARVLCFLFGLSFDSHGCHLCPYACLPYRSWEVKLWPAFLTQELAHYVRLSLA